MARDPHSRTGSTRPGSPKSRNGDASRWCVSPGRKQSPDRRARGKNGQIRSTNRRKTMRREKAIGAAEDPMLDEKVISLEEGSQQTAEFGRRIFKRRKEIRVILGIIAI